MAERTSSKAASVTLPTDDQILIEREFDAPRELVYRAFTTPELVKQWWSAKRGEMTVAEIDLRVGGKWRYATVNTATFEDAGEGRTALTILVQAPNQQIRDAIIDSGMEDGLQDALDLLEEAATSLR